MNRRRLIASALSLAAISRPAFGVAAASDGIIINGEEMRLSDVIAPDGFGLDFKPQAVRNYESFVAQINLRTDLIVEDMEERDRWNRRVVVVRLPSGENLQQEMLRKGLCRVNPETDEAFVESLMVHERVARDARRGLWGDNYYRVRDAQDTELPAGAFHLIEGIVLEGSLRKGRGYLNFGNDFRTDFTVTAPSRSVRKWAKKGLDFESLAAERVRVRGYVSRINGPSIEVSHPKQIELL